jgi:hypothetical protein
MKPYWIACIQEKLIPVEKFFFKLLFPGMENLMEHQTSDIIRLEFENKELKKELAKWLVSYGHNGPLPEFTITTGSNSKTININARE